MRKDNRVQLGGVLLLAFMVASPGVLFAQDWFDGFEDYSVGQFPTDDDKPIWATWTDDPVNKPQEYGAITTDQAASGTKSLQIQDSNDIVVLLSQVNSGVWSIRAKYFLPTDHTGAAYFILMNEFTAGCPEGAPCQWALQAEMISATNEFKDGKGGIRPLIKGRWVEMQVTVDFNSNVVDIYYDGEATTIGAQYAADGTQVAFAAIDLFAGPGSSAAYIDDVSVAAIPAPFRATQDGPDILLTWGIPAEAVKTAVDMSAAFNADVVSNQDDPLEDGIFDASEYRLVEEGFLGGDGLPPNGLVGQFALGNYDDPNALQFRQLDPPAALDDVTITIPEGNYGSILACSSCGSGAVTIPVTVTYTDDSTTDGEIVSLDWFSDPSGGLTMAIDGMDRVNVGTGALQDSNNPGLFQGAIVCDPAKTVKSLTLRPNDATIDWLTTSVVFNLMALTTVAPVTYDITREGLTTGQTNFTVNDATSYRDAGVAEDTYTYIMVASTGASVLDPQVATISWQDAVLNAAGRVATWLILGQYQRPATGTPVAAEMVQDFLAEAAGGKTEANILPVEDMAVNTDFSVAASQSWVCGNRGDPCNTWFRYDISDGYVNFNNIFGDQEQIMAYNVIYVKNNTADVILAEVRCGSDDAIGFLLDNVIWHTNPIARSHGFDQDRVPIAITPGEHRLMVKTFEITGGFGMSFGFYDLFTGEALQPPDLTLSVTPTEMAEVPPPPTVAATRLLPCYVVGDDPITVTIELTPSDVEVDVYELVLPPWGVPTDITDNGAFDPATRQIAWDDVSGSVSYTVAPAAGAPDLVGVIDEAAGLVGIGGMANALPAEDLGGGWVTADIGTAGDPQLAGSVVMDSPEAGCMEITGGGSDIQNTADHFRFVWRKISAENFVMETTVTAFPRVQNDWQKAGIMLRDTCTAGSANVLGLVRAGATDGNPGFDWQGRETEGGGTTYVGPPDVFIPTRIRLIKLGDQVTSYYSTDDGVTWTQHGTARLLPDEDGSGEFLAGLAVTSHDNNVVATGTFCDTTYGELHSVSVAADPVSADLCDGAVSVALTATVTGADTIDDIQWSAPAGVTIVPDDPTRTATATIGTAGTYEITCDVTVNDITASGSVTVQIEACPSPACTALNPVCTVTGDMVEVAITPVPEGCICDTVDILIDDVAIDSVALPGDGILMVALPDPCDPGSEHTLKLVCSSSGSEETCAFTCPGVVFKRGDSNRDGGMNIADAVYILQNLFAQGPDIYCMEAADANDDEGVNIADAVYILQNLFAQGPAIPAPGPDACGPDTTPHPTEPETDLGCEDYCPEACEDPPTACPVP